MPTPNENLNCVARLTAALAAEQPVLLAIDDGGDSTEVLVVGGTTGFVAESICALTQAFVQEIDADSANKAGLLTVLTKLLS
jgi:threonine aldolase